MPFYSYSDAGTGLTEQRPQSITWYEYEAHIMLFQCLETTPTNSLTGALSTHK